MSSRLMIRVLDYATINGVHELLDGNGNTANRNTPYYLTYYYGEDVCNSRGERFEPQPGIDCYRPEHEWIDSCPNWTAAERIRNEM